MNEQFVTRKLSDLKPHPDNPRFELSVDDLSITALAANIKQHGIIEPIVIDADNFILAGHRRRLAATLAGIIEVQCVLRNLGINECVEEIFLAENGHRENLSMLEEAKALRTYKEKLTRDSDKSIFNADIARKLNMSNQVVNQRFAILELPVEIQMHFHRGDLPANSAIEFKKLKDFPDKMILLANKCVSRQISLKQLPELVKAYLNIETEPKPSEKTPKPLFNDYGKQSLPNVDRNVAMQNLQNNLGKKISLFDIRVLFESTCNYCGLSANTEVCKTCPMPKFINGVCGRTEAEV